MTRSVHTICHRSQTPLVPPYTSVSPLSPILTKCERRRTATLHEPASTKPLRKPDKLATTQTRRRERQRGALGANPLCSDIILSQPIAQKRSDERAEDVESSMRLSSHDRCVVGRQTWGNKGHATVGDSKGSGMSCSSSMLWKNRNIQRVRLDWKKISDFSRRTRVTMFTKDVARSENNKAENCDSHVRQSGSVVPSLGLKLPRSASGGTHQFACAGDSLKVPFGFPCRKSTILGKKIPAVHKCQKRENGIDGMWYREY